MPGEEGDAVQEERSQCCWSCGAGGRRHALARSARLLSHHAAAGCCSLPCPRLLTAAAARSAASRSAAWPPRAAGTSAGGGAGRQRPTGWVRWGGGGEGWVGGVVGAAGELGGAGEDAQQSLPSARQPPCAPSDSAPAPKLPTSKRSPMASAMSPKAERICGLMFRCTSGDCRLVSSVCRPRGGKGHTRGAQHAEQELDWAGRGRNTAPELSSRPALRRSRMQKFLARHADSQPPPGS